MGGGIRRFKPGLRRFPDSTRPRILIVGLGFGGLAAAKALGRAPACITLLDRRNHHLFQPLLYQVATATLSSVEIVAPDLSLPGHPEAFVIGDLASFAHGRTGTLPGVAAVAIQQGRLAAANILASLGKGRRKAFHYRDRGSLATIGRGSAVAQLGAFRFNGILAWLLWLFVHLVMLVGFQNRVSVLLGWFGAYLSTQRRARLILEPDRRREGKGYSKDI